MLEIVNIWKLKERWGNKTPKMGIVTTDEYYEFLFGKSERFLLYRKPIKNKYTMVVDYLWNGGTEKLMLDISEIRDMNALYTIIDKRVLPF